MKRSFPIQLFETSQPHPDRQEGVQGKPQHEKLKGEKGQGHLLPAKIGEETTRQDSNDGIDKGSKG
jgi:hypothetical protein